MSRPAWELSDEARWVDAASILERRTLPTTALPWRQRRELLQQLRGRRPVDPARLRLLRDLAARSANPRGQVLMSVGPGLTTLGQTVCAVLLLTSSTTLLRRQAHARRFLENHGHPG